MRFFLGIKLRRDLLRNWSQFAAVLLMAFLAVLIYSGLEGSWYGLQRELNRYADSTTMADAWITTRGAGADDVETIRAVDGVEEASAVRTASFVVGGDDPDSSQLMLEETRDDTLSEPVVVEGAAITDVPGAIWVDREYAAAHDLGVGGTVAVDGQDGSTALEVAGIVLSPDHLYYTGTSALVAPAPASYGYGSVSGSTLTVLTGGADGTVLVRVAGEVDQLRDAVPQLLGDRYVRYTVRSTNTEVATAFDRVDQIRNLSILFSFIFIVLALLAMFTSMRRLAGMQRSDIATLQALGRTNRAIAVHFASYGLVTGGVGAVLGLVVSPLMSQYVLGTQKAMLALPTWRPAWTPVAVVVTVLVASVCAVRAYVAARGALRGVPADGLRGPLPSVHRAPVERLLPRWWGRLSFAARWAQRDAAGNPVRPAMGVVAVAGCLMLLFAGFGMPDSMNAQVDTALAEENTYAARVTLASGTGVEAAHALSDDAQLVQEVVVRTDPDDGFDRVLTVLGPGDFVHLRTQDGAVSVEDGPVLTAGASDLLDVGAGDRLSVWPAGADAATTLTVAHVVEASQPQGVYLSQEEWEASGAVFSPTTVLVGAGTDLDALSDDAAAASVLTRSDQQENAYGLVADLGGIFMMIRAFAVLLAVIVLYSLGSLSFTERARDYATLGVLGFRPRDIRALVLRENVAVTVLGLMLGVPAGLWFLSVYVGTFSTPSIVYTPTISAVSVAVTMVLTAGFSLLTTVLLGRRVASIDVVAALKGVE